MQLAVDDKNDEYVVNTKPQIVLCTHGSLFQFNVNVPFYLWINFSELSQKFSKVLFDWILLSKCDGLFLTGLSAQELEESFRDLLSQRDHRNIFCISSEHINEDFVWEFKYVKFSQGEVALRIVSSSHKKEEGSLEFISDIARKLDKAIYG